MLVLVHKLYNAIIVCTSQYITKQADLVQQLKF